MQRYEIPIYQLCDSVRYHAIAEHFSPISFLRVHESWNRCFQRCWTVVPYNSPNRQQDRSSYGMISPNWGRNTKNSPIYLHFEYREEHRNKGSCMSFDAWESKSCTYSMPFSGFFIVGAVEMGILYFKFLVYISIWFIDYEPFREKWGWAERSSSSCSKVLLKF